VPTNGKIVLKPQTAHAARRCGMQVSQSHCVVYAEWLSQCVDSTADFLNSAQLSPFVTV